MNSFHMAFEDFLCSKLCLTELTFKVFLFLVSVQSMHFQIALKPKFQSTNFTFKIVNTPYMPIKVLFSAKFVDSNPNCLCEH